MTPEQLFALMVRQCPHCGALPNYEAMSYHFVKCLDCHTEFVISPTSKLAFQVPTIELLQGEVPTDPDELQQKKDDK